MCVRPNAGVSTARPERECIGLVLAETASILEEMEKNPGPHAQACRPVSSMRRAR